MLIFILKIVGCVLALLVFLAVMAIAALLSLVAEADHIQEMTGCSEEEAWQKALHNYELKMLETNSSLMPKY